MVDRRKAFSRISSRYHCQRSSPSRISNTQLAGFETAQNLSSGFVKWSWAVVITTTPRHRLYSIVQNLSKGFRYIKEKLVNFICWLIDKSSAFKTRLIRWNQIASQIVEHFIECQFLKSFSTDRTWWKRIVFENFLSTF